MSSRVVFVSFVLAISHLGAQSFSPTGSMPVPRLFHTATLLNNGLVLITGGYVDSTINGITDSAALYDPQSGTWRYTGIGQQSVMNSPRVYHTATKLADGRVLIASGIFHYQPNSGVGGFSALFTNSAEIFDPVTETFTLTGGLNFGRSDHAAVLLSDGRVLVAGSPLGTNVETYNPNTQTWTPYNTDAGHGGHPALARLSDGRVLITGGGPTNRVDLFNPSTNSFQPMMPMLYTRTLHSASILPNGKVLIAGGNDGPSASYTAELYDVAANAGFGGSSFVPGTLSVGGWYSSSSVLPNGDVLLAGGQFPPGNSTGNSTASAQLYSFASNSFTSLSPLSVPRAAFPMTLLATGQILVSGGQNYQGGATTVLTTSELWSGGASPDSINVTTNLDAATFTITGISGGGKSPALSYQGAGKSFSQSGAPRGSYSISYGPSSCASLPSPETQTLTADGITFNGIYRGSLTVAVAVTATPKSSPAPTFSISPPIPNFPSNALLPVTRTAILPGHYRITFNDLPGWITPSAEDFDIAPCANTSIAGNYTPTSGMATLSINLNNTAGGLTVTSTNPSFQGPLACPGSPACLFNILAGASVPSGTYTIVFRDVPGAYTPLPIRVSLSSGQAFSYTGYYRRLFLVGFTGWNNSPSPSGCVIKHGAGVEYTQAQMSQPGMGIGTAVLSALDNLPLQKAIQGNVFTFYDTGNGDACTSPNDESVHNTAGNWLQQQSPSPDDWIVVIGHSYGGNRAQLFATQVQQQMSRPIDLLVTIDPIRFPQCNITNAVLGIGDSQPCNQTSLPTPASTARQVWAYFQTKGHRLSKTVYAVINGYVPLNAVFFQNIPVSHGEIDDDGIVQSAFSNMLLTAVNGPRMAAEVSNPARVGTTISLPLTMTLQPMLNVSGLNVISATLNGVSATNLTSISVIGDLRVGNSRTLPLQFPYMHVPLP